MTYKYKGENPIKELKVPQKNKDISKKIKKNIDYIKKQFSKELSVYDCLCDVNFADKEYKERENNIDFKTGQFVYNEILSPLESWKLQTLFWGIDGNWVKNMRKAITNLKKINCCDFNLEIRNAEYKLGYKVYFWYKYLLNNDVEVICNPYYNYIDTKKTIELFRKRFKRIIGGIKRDKLSKN